MKKFLLLLLVPLLLIGASCGTGPSGGDLTQNGSPETTLPEQAREEPEQETQVVLLDLPSIVDRSPAEVAAVLGEPVVPLTPYYDGKFQGSVCSYKADVEIYETPAFDVEILYLDDKAGRITITPNSEWNYKHDIEKLLDAINLEPESPPSSGPAGKTWKGDIPGWEPIPGIHMGSFIKKDPQARDEDTYVSYIQVVVSRWYIPS